MNNKGQYAIARFIIVLFIFLCLLGLSPMLYSAIQSSKTSLSCDATYTYGFICFVEDAALPIMAIILLAMLIGFLKKS